MRFRNAHMTMHPTSFELVTGTETADRRPAVGVRMNIRQGYINHVDSIVFPITAEDAADLGAALLAHADAMTGIARRDRSAQELAEGRQRVRDYFTNTGDVTADELADYCHR
ncbi:hypothetical protein ACNO8X_18390 [Mycobacterium sp. PDNC021]|uniref:hypothetical protein n=1 Tax=Mycobacterium sp. PDNC021 TaxID=3391399 RepID=UPI003AAED1DC